MSVSTLFIDSSQSSYSTECVQIKNQKIIEFYNLNPNISFEKINLLLLEILQQKMSSNSELEPSSDMVFSDFLRPEEKHKMGELSGFLAKIKEAVHSEIQTILQDSNKAKTEYICEMRSIHVSDSAKMKENNNKFSENIRECCSSLLKLRNCGISDRTNAMLRQFHKILNMNVDSFIANSASDALTEYISNFDLNVSHMINAINGLLSDYASTKEKQIQPIFDQIRKREDVSTAYYKLIYELNDFLQQFEDNNRPKGNFEVVLSKTFPSASIHSDSESNSHVISREDKSAIFIEFHNNKDRNIGTSEVRSFLKTTIEKNTSSILISNYTGISSKTDYQIEILNNRVVVYLHRLNVNPDKIQIAVDMIDSLSAKLEEFCVNVEHKYSIPKEVLDDVNREYQQFIIQKEAIISVLKDQHKQILSKMEDIRFVSLDKYLATRYSSCKKQGFVCDLCNVFNVPTLKGLAAHKRGCARKRVALVSDAIVK